MNVMDHVGSTWVTAFNEVAEQIMGISANELYAKKVSDQTSVRSLVANYPPCRKRATTARSRPISQKPRVRRALFR